MSKLCELNFRDIGGGIVPKGMFLRSGKLSILSHEECTKLCNEYNIKCVIDLRTPVESAEYPDPLPASVEYLQIPLLKDAAVGITHETGSDPMTIIKDYMRTNRNAFWPTIKKCLGVGLLTRNWSLVKTADKSFMADKELIEIAIKMHQKRILGYTAKRR